MSETLAYLRTIPKIPKKYEDTKPALNQAYTHASILEIGEKIALESDERKEKEKQSSLQVREEQVWQKAEDYKDKCVEEALQDANVKAKRKLEKTRSDYERNLQAELSRVEEVLHHHFAEKEHKTQVEVDRKINEIISKLYADFAIEKSVELEQARQKEKEIAHNEKEEMLKNHEKNIEEVRSSDAKLAELKMKQLQASLECSKEEAIQEAVLNEKVVAQDYLKKVERHYQAMIENLDQELAEEKAKRLFCEDQLSEMTSLKDSYVARLLKIKKAFIAFAEKSRQDFYEGQADYLLPQSMFEVEN